LFIKSQINAKIVHYYSKNSEAFIKCNASLIVATKHRKSFAWLWNRKREFGSGFSFRRPGFNELKSNQFMFPCPLWRLHLMIRGPLLLSYSNNV